MLMIVVWFVFCWVWIGYCGVWFGDCVFGWVCWFEWIMGLVGVVWCGFFGVGVVLDVGICCVVGGIFG